MEGENRREDERSIQGVFELGGCQRRFMRTRSIFGRTDARIVVENKRRQSDVLFWAFLPSSASKISGVMLCSVTKILDIIKSMSVSFVFTL